MGTQPFKIVVRRNSQRGKRNNQGDVITKIKSEITLRRMERLRASDIPERQFYKS